MHNCQYQLLEYYNNWNHPSIDNRARGATTNNQTILSTMAAERGHTHKSFLETFRPLHIITRLIGINQFHLPRNYHQSGQILLKRSSLLPFVAQVIMCFGIVILQIVFKLTEVSMSSQFVSMLSSLSALQLISMDLMNRKKIGLIISGLHDIDCMVTFLRKIIQ